MFDFCPAQHMLCPFVAAGSDNYVSIFEISSGNYACVSSCASMHMLAQALRKKIKQIVMNKSICFYMHHIFSLS